MIHSQLIERGIHDPRVLDAFSAVPREDFLPESERGMAYDDRPLPLRHGQTASQPYIVAKMVELLELPENGHALEIGSGCGFQTAVLGHVAQDVCGIEWFRDLATIAIQNLLSLGFTHIEIQQGDGLQGWPDRERRFDGILISFAVPEVPQALLDSLAPRGRLVAPVGNDDLQVLRVYHRREDGGFDVSDHDAVRFVPRQQGPPSE
ncbi:protein-L-isoaspartate O-methyltransferase [Haloferula sargassicola]|uniref:Protein-L-isoaspartate O-methyltransferase n=2 Tax=Haloferula sargassicola TaxID=490096 RepID=A0ABP9UMH1_9BACT